MLSSKERKAGVTPFNSKAWEISKAARALASLSHKKSPRSKEFYQKMQKLSVKKKHGTVII